MQFTYPRAFLLAGLLSGVTACSSVPSNQTSQLSDDVKTTSSEKTNSELLACYSSKHGLPTNKLDWIKLKDTDFKVQGDITFFRIKQVVACLAEPDPAIRDKVAYNALSSWLRAGIVSNEVNKLSINYVLKELKANHEDEVGVYKPFLILALAEFVRADRISPFMESLQRQEVITFLSESLKVIDDYRGFEEQIGWRHQVAHLSDVALQVALNNSFSSLQLMHVYDSLLFQLKQTKHPFVFNEGERLARAVLYGFIRTDIPEGYWHDWFKSLLDIAPLNDWNDVYHDANGLVLRHNVRQFLAPLAVTTLQSKSTKLDGVRNLVQKAWRKTS